MERSMGLVSGIDSPLIIINIIIIIIIIIIAVDSTTSAEGHKALYKWC